MTGKGEEYSQAGLEEDALPYPTVSRSSLVQEEEPKDYTSGADIEKYRGELDDASAAGKLKSPSWKSGSEERSFESEFSQTQKSVLGKAMSYALGFDDAIRLSDADMQPLVQETKDSFGSLLESSGETKKLKNDVLKRYLRRPCRFRMEWLRVKLDLTPHKPGRGGRTSKARKRMCSYVQQRQS